MFGGEFLLTGAPHHGPWLRGAGIGKVTTITEDDSARGRPFLGIHFACCRVYQRIYLNAEETAFVGWCPRCCGKIEVPVDPEGTEDRFFTAG